MVYSAKLKDLRCALDYPRLQRIKKAIFRDGFFTQCADLIRSVIRMLYLQCSSPGLFCFDTFEQGLEIALSE